MASADLAVSVRPTNVGWSNWTGAWILVLGVTSLAFWLIAVGWIALSGAGVLTYTLERAEYQDVGPILFAVVLAIFVAERLWPAAPRSWTSRAHLVDASYLLIFVFIAPAIALLNTGFAIEVSRHASFLFLDRISFVPQLAVVIAILIGMDFMNWLSHVANHRYEALWRMHALHHSQEEMSVFTTFRTHPLAHASYVLAVIPALILEASGTLPSAAIVLYGCLVTLPHANLKWSFGRVGAVLVSPAFHRLHHARTPVNARLAVNYGFVLTVWDRIAGTAVLPTAGTVIETGIQNRSVPIEQTSTATIRAVVLSQIFQPFRRAKF